MENLKGKRVSLVLGSGGARGLAHIGVIQALEEKGAIIDEIVGCSIGSLIGGIYATGELDKFTEWVTKLTSMDVWGLMDFTWKSTGWLKGDRLLRRVQKRIPDIKIEDMPILFSAVSTNLSLGQDVNITSGSMYDAIRASIAIPGILTAVNKKSGTMVDGGVLNPLPLNYVRKKENIVIAVNLEASSDDLEDDFKDESSLTILQHSYYLMRNQITQLTIDLHKPNYVINIPRSVSGIWDYDKAEFLITKGKERAWETLPY